MRHATSLLDPGIQSERIQRLYIKVYVKTPLLLHLQENRNAVEWRMGGIGIQQKSRLQDTYQGFFPLLDA